MKIIFILLICFSFVTSATACEGTPFCAANHPEEQIVYPEAYIYGKNYESATKDDIEILRIEIEELRKLIWGYIATLQESGD